MLENDMLENNILEKSLLESGLSDKSPLENNRVVVLGGGDVRSCELDVAVKLGLQVSYIGDTTHLDHLKGHRQVTFYDVDMTETDRCIDALKNGPEDMEIDAVISFTENGLLTASAMAKKLRANANTLFPVVHTKDKTRMRALLQQNPILALPFKHCVTVEDALDFLQKNGASILKPMYGAGSIGVCKVTREQDVKNYFNDYEFDTVLIEKFVEGEEYSIESLTYEGKHLVCAITQKMTTGVPHFVELGHILPATLEKKIETKIRETVELFLNLVQQQDGPAHTEVKVDDGKVYIIESQTRVGGDQITTLFELASGINLFEETYKLLLDDEYQLPTVELSRMTQIRYIETEPGVLEQVRGIDAAAEHAGIFQVKINKEPGTLMQSMKGSPDRLGYVLATGGDQQDVSLSIQSAMKHIEPVVSPAI